MNNQNQNSHLTAIERTSLSYPARIVQKQNKLIGAICHGSQTLISANLVKGKKITSWWSMQIDLTNAGGTVLDLPVVIDGNLITSRAPIDLADFTDAIIAEILK